ncbi:Uncharacterized protein Adt_39673 [Abeliophyllum distichum]|uniref:Uncharacterized protein n=1 Tax=Abeliophyllum distichum TaxID=126358 RepID=A0ABD1Q5S6_9LAMI
MAYTSMCIVGTFTHSSCHQKPENTTTSRKGKEIVESSNVNKRTRRETPQYKTYLTEHADERAKTISNWTLHPERKVDLASVESSGVLEEVMAKGWTKLCAQPYKIYTPVVHEFLANFNPNIFENVEDEEEDHSFKTYVRGVWVRFSPADIQNYFGLEVGIETPISRIGMMWLNLASD